MTAMRIPTLEELQTPEGREAARREMLATLQRLGTRVDERYARHAAWEERRARRRRRIRRILTLGLSR